MASATFPEKSGDTPEARLLDVYLGCFALNRTILEHRGTTHPSARLSNAAMLVSSNAQTLHQLGSNTTGVVMKLHEALDHAQQAIKIFHYPQDFEGSELQPAAFALHANLTPPPVLHQHLTALKLHVSNYTQSVGL
jgi:hypothetical protein